MRGIHGSMDHPSANTIIRQNSAIESKVSSQDTVSMPVEAVSLIHSDDNEDTLIQPKVSYYTSPETHELPSSSSSTSLPWYGGCGKHMVLIYLAISFLFGGGIVWGLNHVWNDTLHTETSATATLPHTYRIYGSPRADNRAEMKTRLNDVPSQTVITVSPDDRDALLKQLQSLPTQDTSDKPVYHNYETFIREDHASSSD